MRNVIALLIILFYPFAVPAVTLAKNGRAKVEIVLGPNATPTENFAAQQLASNLLRITGAKFKIITNAAPPSHAIVIAGDGGTNNLDGEEWTIRTKGERLFLGGGRPRGTLYAVSRFLQDQCGVRWWTPWASRIPKQATLRVSSLDFHGKPAFEYRAPHWRAAFDSDWAWENLCNSEFANLTSEKGGAVRYAGFVHTFYHLVPPEKYFAEHPEWFSLVKGQRTHQNAQLCTTNPKLRDFMVEQVRSWLRKNPDANIVSVSQNDCFGACECPECKALDDAEGSHAGSMIALVNYIADKIAPEFPNVAIDTLAYQYTRKPPRTLRPRPNVIVRLCSIECNFREPLNQPANASFGNDLRGWAQQADRLYIWDYVTDFGHYFQPNPNWYELGPNLRFFQANHVRGVFDEGAYESFGAEMSELRAWVSAQLLRDPTQDDHALIREFVNGYYGAAGPYIERYVDLMHKASEGYNLTCYFPTDAPFLHFETLAQAEKIWQEAEKAVAGDDETLARVRMGHLSTQYVWLSRWRPLRKECRDAGATWPLDQSREAAEEAWRKVANGNPDRPWTKVTALHEGGQTPDEFLAALKK